MSDRDLLALQYRTIFVTDASARIVRTNDPDPSAGPLLWLAGSADGNVFGLRADVSPDVAGEVHALLAEEPVFVPPHDTPHALDRCVRLLTRDGAIPRYIPGMVYALPTALPAIPGATTVDSESAEGRALYNGFRANGMPEGLKEIGFIDAGEFWAPWCAALVDGVPVSACFAARLSDDGAEAGVATARAFRGRGLAAAATAGWTRIASLQPRALFYATDRTNLSSQRVAARLGLRRIGNRMTLS